VVDGTVNEDTLHAVSPRTPQVDNGYTVEMRFNLAPMGYDITQPNGDIVEWNISIYDTDWFWPLNAAKFSENRVWWQDPWGNVGWYGETRIYAKPSVTVASGPLPAIAPELVIPNAGTMAAPVIDGDLNDPLWAVAPSLDIRYGDDALRATYGGVAKDRAGRELAVHESDKSRWQIQGASAGAIVEYQIYIDSPGPFGSQLNDHHAFLNLAQILMYPVGSRAYPMRLRFTDVPSGWKIATAMTASFDWFLADNYDRLVDSPVEIGSFQEGDFDEGGGHYRVVVDADSADYDLQAMISTLRRLAAAATDWMNDRPYQTFLFIYHFPRGASGGGMEHAYSTAIDIGANRLAENPLSLGDLTSHEFFHLWNVKRIRPASLEPVDFAKEQYSHALWFAEGAGKGGDYPILANGLYVDYYLAQKNYDKALDSYNQALKIDPHLAIAVLNRGWMYDDLGNKYSANVAASNGVQTVTGNVTASDKVDIRDNGSVDGDIVSPRVAIAEGAHFRGSVDMQRKGSAAPQEKAKAAAAAAASTPQGQPTGAGQRVGA
jgi:hypothetical protein